MTLKNIFFTTFLSLVFVSSLALAQHKTRVPQAAVSTPNHQQSVTGTLEIVFGDPIPGSFTSPVYIFYLREDNGKTTKLLLDPSILRIQSEVTGWAGRRVKVSVIVPDQILNSNKSGQTLSVSAMTLVTDKSNISHSKFRQTTQRITTQSGSKPWVTIYCKFGDDPSETDNNDYYERMYSNAPGGLNHYWRENSYESMNLDGSSSSVQWVELRGDYDFYMTGTVTIDGETSPAPDLNLLFDHCTYAAAELVDFDNGGDGYYGINMMFNKTLGCCAFGGIRGKELTGIWKPWGVTWLPPEWGDRQSIVAHEMGHAYGLLHSNNWDGDDNPYDNPWDLMSDPFSPQQVETPWYGKLSQHTIAYNKYELGWISGDQLLEVTPGTTVSTTLDAMGQASTVNHRMAMIQIDKNSYYTVEARKRVGVYETAIPDDAIIIHEVVNGRQEPAWAVDSDIPPADWGDNEGTMWRVGETFTSPTGGIFVSVDAETAEGFKVTIKNAIFKINAGLNDAWYDPDTDGQGFFITVFPNLGAVSLAWFTYDTELPPMDAVASLGDAGHRWLTAVGRVVDNQSVMEIELTSGGLFDSSAEVTHTDPPGSDGTIILTFDSCNSGTVEYNIPSINRQGIVPIRRVANDNIAICEALKAD